MKARSLLARAIAIVGHAPIAANADSEAIEQLRDEMTALRTDYEARIGALEARLSAADTAVVEAVPTVEPAPFAQPNRWRQTGHHRYGNEFNPAASLILTGTYGQLSEDPADYQIGGFIPSEGDVGPPGRSFQLGESELTLSANIDPYFSGYFVGAFDGDGGTSVEEAFVRHVGLIPGGRLSSAGFCRNSATQRNSRARMGLRRRAARTAGVLRRSTQARRDTGRWVAPTSLLLEVGVELGLGDQFPGTDRTENGANAMMLFAHIGGDVGFSHSYRFGATVRTSKADERTYRGPRCRRRAGDERVHRRHRHVGARLRVEVVARRKCSGAQS